MSIKIGRISVGYEFPVVVQSMTNTNTNDIEDTVEQCIRIFNAGAQMVRITVQGTREVESLSVIRRILIERGYFFPLIADVHFSPKLAEEAAKIVEKVRINPGNYAENKKREHSVLSKEEYQEDLNNIRNKLKPLLKICKEKGTALRIGVNHGSLSGRIMTRYGDTPEGMAESAMEFIRICRSERFVNLVISMKASNTRIMVYACRMLMHKMENEHLILPVHLGVTEAGADDSGRIKSAVGIACLLQEGIGDTIRVSLTEDPENEIPPALEIVNYFGQTRGNPPAYGLPRRYVTSWARRTTRPVMNIGGNYPPVIVTDFSDYSQENYDISHLRKPDFVFCPSEEHLQIIPQEQSIIVNTELYEGKNLRGNIFPLGTVKDFRQFNIPENKPFFLLMSPEKLSPEHINILKNNPHVVLTADSLSSPDPSVLLSLFTQLEKHQIKCPVIICKKFRITEQEKLMIRAAGESGIFFLDGMADGLWLRNSGKKMPLTDYAFEILQASRVRTTTVDYIACPSCGRTQFDIQRVLKEVKKNTANLSGIRIAVMGCIVNGPGEMADADYGYIGSGPGKVTLYKGKEPVMKNIPEKEAIDKLMELIRRDEGLKNMEYGVKGE